MSTPLAFIALTPSMRSRGARNTTMRVRHNALYSRPATRHTEPACWIVGTQLRLAPTRNDRHAR